MSGFRRVRVVAPFPLAVSVAALTVELGCVAVYVRFTPGTPAWLSLTVWAVTLVSAAVCVGALRRAVSGRPRVARHHGALNLSGATVARTAPTDWSIT